MARHLVVVESPAKARTVGRILGEDFLVLASLGPLRDLPKDRLGVDTARGFAAEYQVPSSRRRILAELRAAAREAESIYLAADPDGEGEAFCWHLAQELAPAAGRKPLLRVAFHEITAPVVAEAFRSPRALDARQVEAQQTRRILDRLVDHAVGPLLRKQPRLSAGRVPSVALRIVCEREREIEAFARRERWTLRARLEAGGPYPFAATWVGADGDTQLTSALEADSLRRALEASAFRVGAIARRERRSAPPSPFVTSTLQQEAFDRLHFAAKKTRTIAERLYEGIELRGEGPVALLTYPRTGSTRVAPGAGAAACREIVRRFGPAYAAETPTPSRTPTAAPPAEAVRPTDLARTPDSLQGSLAKDELALYRLVYDRFLASQMVEAVYDEVQVEVEARPAHGAGPSHLLRANGATLRFPGHLAAHPETPPEEGPRPNGRETLPPLEQGLALALLRIEVERQSEGPPPRFHEATLSRDLERSGLGRPSTCAAILARLAPSDYVRKAKGRLVPTPLGFSVVDFLAERLPELISKDGAAALEDALDAIEQGRQTRLGVLTAFWRRLQLALGAARAVPVRPLPVDAVGAGEPELGRCPECGAGLARRTGRYGELVGCSRYPACRHVARKQAPSAGLTCPRCHEGAVVERQSETGRVFFACSRYPACRFTSHHRPLAESCPECGCAYLFEKHTKREGRVVFCGNESCRFQRRG